MPHKVNHLYMTYFIDLLQGYFSVVLRLTSNLHDQVFYAITNDFPWWTISMTPFDLRVLLVLFCKGFLFSWHRIKGTHHDIERHTQQSHTQPPKTSNMHTQQSQTQAPTTAKGGFRPKLLIKSKGLQWKGKQAITQQQLQDVVKNASGKKTNWNFRWSLCFIFWER